VFPFQETVTQILFLAGKETEAQERGVMMALKGGMESRCPGFQNFVPSVSTLKQALPYCQELPTEYQLQFSDAPVITF
jgi:hypothetical protein